MKALFRFLVLFSAIFIIVAAVFILDFLKRNNLALPRTLLGDISLSGFSQTQTREMLKTKLQQFTNKPFQMAARGEVQSVTLAELGIIINESVILDEIPFAGNMTNPEIILWSIAGRRIIPNITVERTEVLRALDQKFQGIPKTQNAYFAKEKGEFLAVEAKEGLIPDTEPLITQIKNNITFLEHAPLTVTFKKSTPTIFAQDIEKYKFSFTAALPKSIALLSEKNKWDVNFADNPEWIAFEKKPHSANGDEMPFSLNWHPLAFANFINDEISATLEQMPEAIRIWRDENQKVQFEGHASEGRRIEMERLLTIVNQAIERKIAEVEIPLAVVLPKIEISPDLQALGIKELIGVGYTRFEGSPANRKHNIGVGTGRFNGILIPAGETFSFGKHLGPVDASTGYKKELVIKPEGTIPEFGGGLCQVSSTIYRAAIFTGLPIVERKAHSYAVRYYAQVGGHGLDATVYPPAVDLKFTNDTPGHILVHAYVDSDAAYFKFFGTSDGRTVKMDGPYISNKRSAPAEPLLVPDPKLSPGEKKQVEKPHGGFDALWYRYVTKNGKTLEEKIISKYRAVPAKFLVGGEVKPAEGAAGDAPPTNPFE